MIVDAWTQPYYLAHKSVFLWSLLPAGLAPPAERLRAEGESRVYAPACWDNGVRLPGEKQWPKYSLDEAGSHVCSQFGLTAPTDSSKKRSLFSTFGSEL